MGRSTEEALAASRERVGALWGDEDATGGSAGEAPVDTIVRPDTPQAVQETLERAAQVLGTAPGEDQEEMVDLIEDLHNALKEGRTDDAAAIKQNLDEILFYLE